MASKKTPSTAAQQKKVAALVKALDQSLKKVGDPKHQSELRQLLGQLHDAHLELYKLKSADGWVDVGGWVHK